MKCKVRALAEAMIFQAVVCDSKSRKRAVIVYACGDDVFWADDFFGLFDRDKRRTAPQWLKDQLKNTPADTVRLNWQGNRVDGTALSAQKPSNVAAGIVQVPEGEDLGEDDIKQG